MTLKVMIFVNVHVSKDQAKVNFPPRGHNLTSLLPPVGVARMGEHFFQEFALRSGSLA